MKLNEVIGCNYLFAILNKKKNIKFKFKYILGFLIFYIKWENKCIAWFYKYNLINNTIIFQHNLLNYKNPGTQTIIKLYFGPNLTTRKIRTCKILKVYKLKVVLLLFG